MIRPSHQSSTVGNARVKRKGIPPAFARTRGIRSQPSMVFDLQYKVARLIHRLPGKKRFGVYRFVPLFFFWGALLEFSMINWEAGPAKTNFYKTFTKNKAREVAEEELAEEEKPVPWFVAGK